MIGSGGWLERPAARLALMSWVAASGALLPVAPVGAVVLAGIPALVAAVILLRPLYWVLGALVWILVGPPLASLGLVPMGAERLDILLVWGGFVLAMATRPAGGSLSRGLVLGVLVLAASFAISGMAGGASPGATFLGLLLIAAPIALICTVLLDPPNARDRRMALWFLLGIAYLQVPICFLQWVQASSTDPDAAVGTFVGTVMGAHIAGAVAGVAAIWIVSQARKLSQAALVLPLLAVLFLTDSKQIILALPLAAVLSPAATRLASAMRFAVATGIAVALLLAPTLSSAYDYAGQQINQVFSGESTKVAVLGRVASELGASPAHLAFGLGPGNSVGFLSLLSSPYSYDDQQRSQLAEIVGLKESQLASDFGEPVGAASFSSQYSSLVGVAGDLGVVGLIVYAAILVAVISTLWRSREPEDSGAIAAVMLMVVLGAVFIWWEYLPFTLYVASFAALALVRDGRSDAPILRLGEHVR